MQTLQFTTEYKNGATTTTVNFYDICLFELRDKGGEYSDIYAMKEGLEPYPINTLNGWNYEEDKREESEEEIIEEFQEWVKEEGYIYLENMAPQFLEGK